MLVGNILEKTDAISAWQLCADKLADWVRTSWQEHKTADESRWEDAAHEDPAALPGLREEGFTGLVGLDYILKWWGNQDSEELAGQLDVVWKVMDGNSIACYKAWVKLADRDFILGIHKGEDAKRETNREEFRKAFAQWKKLFEGIN